MITPRQMFRARCAACAHVYDVIATPVPVLTFVRAARASACTMCGNRTGNTCAPARDIEPAPPLEAPAEASP